jgi:hypothetical protein
LELTNLYIDINTTMSTTKAQLPYYAVEAPTNRRGVYHGHWEQFNFLEAAVGLRYRQFDDKACALYFVRYGHVAGEGGQSCAACEQEKEAIGVRRGGEPARVMRFQREEGKEKTNVRQ